MKSHPCATPEESVERLAPIIQSVGEAAFSTSYAMILIVVMILSAVRFGKYSRLWECESQAIDDRFNGSSMVHKGLDHRPTFWSPFRLQTGSVSGLQQPTSHYRHTLVIHVILEREASLSGRSVQSLDRSKAQKPISQAKPKQSRVSHESTTFSIASPANP